MQDNPYSINSRLWWEAYFVEDWDSHGGTDQTRYFMQRLLSELPLPEAAFMRSRTLTILDWGCAFGEGVELLAQAFPQSHVAGLDFASTAIERARSRHPKREFILAENGEIPTEFDVIITSNCLEHFEQPLEVVTAHLRSCRELYIALVPYDECPLSESHRFRFNGDSFPERIGDRVRLSARTIEVTPPFWNGKQLLVVYGSQSYLSKCRAAHYRGSEQEKWDSYYANLPLYDADETTTAFNAELVERVSELLPAGSRILEAGCGGGWHSLALAKTGNFQVTLMDFSREALAYSRRLFEREQLSAQFICEDVFSPGESDFDLVFNAGVLEHYSLEEQATFLRGMACRSRNYVLALVPNRLCYWYWIWRVHKSGKGEWPFGKEVPVSDFSSAFDLAGLEFLGQTVMGKRWTEFFITDLAGMDRNLCDQILEIHRSPIIPEEQQGYLLAALGSVSSKPAKSPPIWMRPPLPEDAQKAEIIAALADALALRIGAEQGLSQQRAKALESEQTAQVLTAQTEDKEQALQRASSELAEKDKSLQVLLADLCAKGQELEALSSEVALKDQAHAEMSARILEEEHVTESLKFKLAEKNETIESLASGIAEKERAANVLSERLSAKDYELERMTNTLAWRLLSRYGRIKYRYLLPVYRALGLPPYGKQHPGAAQTNQPLLETSSDHGQPAQLTDSIVGLRTTAEHVAENVESYPSCESSAHDVVCFPIIDWDFRFQRPQQLMTQFAAAGHRVFYISQSFYSDGPAYTIQEKRQNIYEIALRGPERNVYADFLDDKARDVLFASLDALRRDLSLGATVAFAELPFWWPLVDKTRAEFAWPIIYDCMDYHPGFSTNRTEMLDHERSLLESADLVVVSSEFLKTRARQHNLNVFLVRNACDYEHFAKAATPKNVRPLIGYYGAIAEWFDSDLVADLAERRPDWDFVLVGSTFGADTSRLSRLSNVSLPGEKHYSEIPDWLGTFDVAIIPFKRTVLTEATNPVKVYEILAAGKPLVSVPIPEVSRLAPLVRQASNVDEFETEVLAALNTETREFEERRRAYAREHTWQKRYETLTPLVRNAFSKASIVIVTFNNLALNRLCLESLYARTEWPNCEVIAVDNGSSDGTPEYLKEAEKTFPNLRVMLNDENLGFSTANNIGLKQASGDYLVLLNNDTVLTRGWLSALIRHLHADPEVGLIGPVTNEIGNEAKVKVGYKRLKDLPRWAAQFVRDNDGRAFSIPVLAMFCVAMRRTDFERVGLLDESFEIGMFEDDDYARRVQEKGYKTTCVFDSFVHHAGRASFKLLDEDHYNELFQRNRRIYEGKWGLWEPHIDVTARQRIPDLLKRLRVILDQSRVGHRRIIVFLPSIGWKTPLAQRPQHLARELARQGFLVFFDCSGSINDHFVGFQRVEKRLWLYKGPRGVLETLDQVLLWALPYNAALADRWTGARIIYDFVDDLSALAYNQKALRMNHDRMLETADLVLCAARNLIDQVAGLRPDALYIPTGVDHSVFSSADSPFDLETALNEMIELRDGTLRGGPMTLRARVEGRLANHLREIEAHPRATESERRDFLSRYGMGFWRVLGRKWLGPPTAKPPVGDAQTHGKRFAPVEATSFHPGRCNVCGRETSFYYSDPALYRESLVCRECGTTSRYRSIARGILRAIREITGAEAASIAELATMDAEKTLKIYDTQAPFYFDGGAYPIPDLLARCKWLDVRTSLYRPQQRLGKKLGPKQTNQSLEALTFPDSSFDILVTSDVMEHVRLDFRAHQEIRRVLKSGGVYLFTVPHLRDRRETFHRVAVLDPADPAKDTFLTAKEYHGDANADDGRALSYRTYGTDLDETLQRLGFTVDYCKTDFPRAGIINTELFFCRLVK